MRSFYPAGILTILRKESDFDFGEVKEIYKFFDFFDESIVFIFSSFAWLNGML